MTGQIIIKGFIDPRVGDELETGIFVEQQELNFSMAESSAAKVREAQDIVGGREMFVRWGDNTTTRIFSGSGPAPPYPVPKRDALRLRRCE